MNDRLAQTSQEVQRENSGSKSIHSSQAEENQHRVVKIETKVVEELEKIARRIQKLVASDIKASSIARRFKLFNITCMLH